MIPLRFSRAFLEKWGHILGSWWDTNWKKATIFYPARSAGMMNIQQVFQVTAEGEAALAAIVDEQGWKPLPNDEKMYRIMLWVGAQLRYLNDSAQFGKVEFWADPFGILKSKTDDCDGFAVLMAYLGWAAGIPRYRLKVAAGDILQNGQTIGHAYCLYLKEDSNLWHTCEGSFYPDEARKRFRENTPHSDAKRYSSLWWTTTDEESWAQHDLSIKEGIHSEIEG